MINILIFLFFGGKGYITKIRLRRHKLPSANLFGGQLRCWLFINYQLTYINWRNCLRHYAVGFELHPNNHTYSNFKFDIILIIILIL